MENSEINSTAPTPPAPNPAPAPPRSSTANFFRFLLCAAIPLAVLITIFHSSGCVHPTNPFALPRTFNFTAAAPEPMVTAPEPTASPPLSVSHELYVPPGDDFSASAPEPDFPRKIRPGRNKHPPATRNKHPRAKTETGESPTPPATRNKHLPAKNKKTGESPTPPATNTTGESPTPTIHAPHSTTAVSVLVLYQGRIGIFIPIAPVCATGISILVIDTMVKNGDAIHNYLANLDKVLIGSIIGEGIAIIVPYMWPENQLTTSLSMILLVATIALCCLFGDLKLVNKVVGAAACLTMVEICAFGLKKNLGNLSVACMAEVYCIFSLVLVTRGDAPPLYRRL